MGLKEQMAADVAIFLNTGELADNVIYNGVEIPAVIEFGADAVRGNTFTSDGQASRAVIWVSVMDVPEPKANDSIEVWNEVASTERVVGEEEDAIGGEADSAGLLLIALMGGKVWRVARVIESDGTMHCLECIAEESPW